MVLSRFSQTIEASTGSLAKESAIEMVDVGARCSMVEGGVASVEGLLARRCW